jgi:CHAT domain-containing protein
VRLNPGKVEEPIVHFKLVTLSACDTGMGTTSNGEGIYGLRRALTIAGAESQVISLWKVADDATKDLMINYYTRLKANEGRSIALHNAQRDMLKSEKYNHPYYWAAFIPSGDWRPLGN